MVGQTLLLLLLLVGTKYTHSLTHSTGKTRQGQGQASSSKQQARKQASDNDVRGLECFWLRLGLVGPGGFKGTLVTLSQYFLCLPYLGTQVCQQYSRWSRCLDCGLKAPA